MAVTDRDLEEMVTEDQNQPPSIIESNRYRIIHPEFPLGRGTWGAVYRARDKETAEEVAVKVLEPTDIALDQLKKRKLNMRSAMAKEAIELSKSKGIVPRRLEFDENGKPFLVMPVYDEFLNHFINGWEFGREVKDSDYVLNSKIKILNDIAEGLSSLHSGLSKRVHGDLKPDNIAIHFGRAYINDLGTSTIEYVSGGELSKGQRGFEKTRAPENFYDFVEPDARSDVFSWGALAYRMFTGEYPIDTSPKLDKGKIKNKIKKHIPISLRKPILKALEINPKERQHNGNELEEDWSEAVDDYNNHTKFKRFLKKSAIVAGISGIAALGFVGGKLVDKIPEPERIIVPVELGSDVLYKGMIFKPGSSKEVLLPVEIQYEKIENPVEIPLAFGMAAIKHGMIRRSTNDPVVAYLIKCAEEAGVLVGGLAESYFSPDQAKIMWDMFRRRDAGLERADVNPVIMTWARTIEPVYKNMVEEGKGKVDLEDLMVAVRMGGEVLHKARSYSGSLDYNVYKEAKDEYGDEIIPQSERKFINAWLSAYHQDEN